MDTVELVKKCNIEEDFIKLKEKLVKTYTEIAHKENMFDFIGNKMDINPNDYHLDEPDYDYGCYYQGVTMWQGFIPLGTKIVYGRYFSEETLMSSHQGSYYYVDDDSYILEFLKFLKTEEVEDELDLIIAVAKFLKNYFIRFFEPKERDVFNQLIYMNENIFFRPVKEHSIKSFYCNGSAMCTELSLIAENLLSLFGVEIFYFMDKEHAFNFYISNDEDREFYILDYSEWVECFDHNFNVVGIRPFIGELKEKDKFELDKIISEGRRIEVPDYFLYLINDKLYRIYTGEMRNYGIDYAEEKENTLILNRK